MNISSLKNRHLLSRKEPNAKGVTYLFPIQSKTFHTVYSGKDVVVQARTGTGKTFSFGIPLVERLSEDQQPLARGRAPTDGIDFLVGTPGRIRDLVQNYRLDLTVLKHVVLDEVDMMFDMGFSEQVEEILSVRYKPDPEENPQTLLFSATCPDWMYNVAKKYMRQQYEKVDLVGHRSQKAAITVEHLAIECNRSQKAAVLGDIVQVYSGSHGKTIIFCDSKLQAHELSTNCGSLKQGVCFDVRSENLLSMQESWSDTRRWQFTITIELPAIQESEKSFDGGTEVLEEEGGDLLTEEIIPEIHRAEEEEEDDKAEVEDLEGAVSGSKHPNFFNTPPCSYIFLLKVT
ncbi:nucleolar RNA helicase 2-B-like [Xenopus laevis]|uniref:Nucleolar RNA helicase 2-B-like n=1 Tax=Xenopus laevis TaxID=8355 RepID=A0A8J1L7Y9_XENLA|nr:nucleolar RNA helicase 2-B-like [Xenopus laevis]